ncbi:MAG: hypothetical protein RLZZ196_2990 [Bacteroidota bacterium]|jgi:cytidylate kinase
MEKKYLKDHPIILGLAGRAGSGKTSAAEALCPKGSMQTTSSGIIWEHIFHALPLYELASIKKNIKGFNADSRKLYAIHEVLFEIYGKSTLGLIPSYEIFVEKVKEIFNLSIEPEGTKPRSFLQKAGDICRDDYAECFCHWVTIKSMELYRKNINNLLREDGNQDTPICVIVSDVRFENEALSILKQPNGIIITYEASDDVLRDRIFKRDGVYMTDEQLNHNSEKEIELVRKISTFTINTDNLSIEDQAKKTLEFIKNFTEKAGE